MNLEDQLLTVALEYKGRLEASREQLNFLRSTVISALDQLRTCQATERGYDGVTDRELADLLLTEITEGKA